MNNIPTDEWIQLKYAIGVAGDISNTPEIDEACAEFDRWLAQHDANEREQAAQRVQMLIRLTGIPGDAYILHNWVREVVASAAGSVEYPCKTCGFDPPTVLEDASGIYRIAAGNHLLDCIAARGEDNDK